MMVNSFCGEFLLQSHAALHGEFLLVLHTLCWFMWRAPLARPCAGLYREFLLHPQCWFMCGVSLTHPMLASFVGCFSHKVYAGFFIKPSLVLGNFSFTKQKEQT